jgi:ParB-like chromosome segregation protein Spo0J
MPSESEPAATYEPIASLKPWKKNPRKNDGEPVDRVAESIRRFGFSSPIIARLENRQIIAGHTRWKAAKKLGLAEVPVRFLDIDEAQAEALALADNKLSEITPWDEEGLAEVMRSLDAVQTALDGLGWSADELNAILGKADCATPEDPFAALPDGAPEFRQMTFTLTYDQHERVEAALRDAIDAGPFVGTGNTNRNGNALARIAEAFHG